MTTVYQCNRCKDVMHFEDDKYVILNVGAGHEGQTFEGNKTGDLCPNCHEAVQTFINTPVKKSANKKWKYEGATAI